MREAQKTPNRFTALLPIVQRPVVHVHPDEFVREVPTHVPRELERVLNRLRPMLEAEPDARGQDSEILRRTSGSNRL